MSPPGQHLKSHMVDLVAALLAEPGRASAMVPRGSRLSVGPAMAARTASATTSIRLML